MTQAKVFATAFTRRSSHLNDEASSDASAFTLRNALQGQGAFLDELNCILKNADAESRWDEISQLANRLQQNQKSNLAYQVYGIVAQAAPLVGQRRKAETEANAIGGLTPAGFHFESTISRVAGDAINLKLIVPMMAASAFGPVATTVLLGRAAPILGRGLMARAGMGLTSYLVELPIFAGVQSTLQGGNFTDHLKQAAMILGAVKLASGFSSEVKRAIDGLMLPHQSSRLKFITEALLPQVALFGALHLPKSQTSLDTMAEMLSINLGTHLGRRLLPSRFIQLERELQMRSEAAAPPSAFRRSIQGLRLVPELASTAASSLSLTNPKISSIRMFSSGGKVETPAGASKRVENLESFYNRLVPILAPQDLMKVELAYVLAKYGHRAQFRKELDPNTGKAMRYFEHPRRVALILIDEVRCVDPIVVQAALIHDGYEDTKLLRPEFIEVVLGKEVASIVKMLSKVPKEGYLERLLAYGDWRTLLIKTSDRLDNLRSLGHATAEFQKKQILETRDKYFPVFDRLIQLVPAPYSRGAKVMRAEIHQIVRDYEVKLDLPRNVAPQPRSKIAKK